MMIARNIVAVIFLAVVASSAFGAEMGRPDGAVIDRLTGVKGKANEQEGTYKVMVPRSDISLNVAGARVTPPMGLTSWAAFKKMGDETMVMGDIVLRQEQIDPVMDAALGNGLQVTALHNHFTFENPRIMYMHIGGMGTDAELAAAIGKVFAAVKASAASKTVPHRSNVNPARSSLTADKLAAILGKGEYQKGVFKIVIGRTTAMGNHEAGKEMGVNTWAAFAGTDDKAVVDGDFAMLESELQPVLKALRSANISVVAIHNHMTFEQPRIMFLHFWGAGKAEELARGLKGALAKTAVGQ